MKVCMTGWHGFLSSKLRECEQIDWRDSPVGTDVLVLMGSPTFTQHELSQNDAQDMHTYVRDTIRLIDSYAGRIVFASTTGVDDIQLDHAGSTAYNLAKLYLENYIVNHCSKYTILRIGTIVSKRKSDVTRMKPDRVQPKIAQGVFDVDDVDYYLDVDTFVNSTIKYILDQENGIKEYELIKLTKMQLMFYGVKDD